MRESSPIAYDSKIEGNVIFTRLDAAINWMRSNSLWPMPMGLACCAIELMAASSSRYDISRFGAEVMRFSPRQSDVMIVAGTVTYKLALAVKRRRPATTHATLLDSSKWAGVTTPEPSQMRGLMAGESRGRSTRRIALVGEAPRSMAASS